MKLLEFLLNVLHAETIERKAISLLNHLTCLVLLPTTQVTAEIEKSYLATTKSTQKAYKITIFTKSLVEYSCKGFRYSNICSRAVAVLEKGRVLTSHIVKFKSRIFRASIIYPIKPGGEGRKGGQKGR